jgi:hypothetical protein
MDNLIITMDIGKVVMKNTVCSIGHLVVYRRIPLYAVFLSVLWECEYPIRVQILKPVN